MCVAVGPLLSPPPPLVVVVGIITVVGGVGRRSERTLRKKKKKEEEEAAIDLKSNCQYGWEQKLAGTRHINPSLFSPCAFIDVHIFFFTWAAGGSRGRMDFWNWAE